MSAIDDGVQTPSFRTYDAEAGILRDQAHKHTHTPHKSPHNGKG